MLSSKYILYTASASITALVSVGSSGVQPIAAYPANGTAVGTVTYSAHVPPYGTLNSVTPFNVPFAPATKLIV